MHYTIQRAVRLDCVCFCHMLFQNGAREGREDKLQGQLKRMILQAMEKIAFQKDRSKEYFSLGRNK